ncbi:hypothetical protein I317_04819 [Kwoniella heveanensis CBS 569]|uniref:SGNH hydrolase-type esterase domain-containing protein n=1 Tax=Kwoniella heveanensis BCC8398 TaxID=1296120 RepID=A0A1B9H441_9TREE|nr:hypothetical protein I316_00260 [Kwoniella heveanensis BCC8398]OCF41338.1 hypothetical protein I317_04819 [Kwoniella heveanensis CBS 569]
MAKPLQDCIILFGDSLTERQDVPQTLDERMNRAYGRKLDVLNRGFGGYTSTLGVALLDHIFAPKEDAAASPVVRLVTLFFGTNDSVNFPNPRATPPEVFKSNTHHMLTQLTSPTSPYAIADTPVHIILITPPPPYDPQVPLPAKWVRDQARSLRFAEAVRELGKEWKVREGSEENQTGWRVEVLDLWAEMEKRAGGLGHGLAPFFHDGCHMTTEGYQVLWDLYTDLIKGKWKGHGLDWEDEQDLPMRVPWYGHLDMDQLEESLKEELRLPACRR